MHQRRGHRHIECATNGRRRRTSRYRTSTMLAKAGAWHQRRRCVTCAFTWRWRKRVVVWVVGRWRSGVDNAPIVVFLLLAQRGLPLINQLFQVILKCSVVGWRRINRVIAEAAIVGRSC